jgi:mannose-6-phosphate isomerase-like protein (cupin superfamily)
MTTTILPKISLPSTLSTMTSHYHPKLVAILNSSIEFRVSKMRGPFLWHAHHSTDELYYVLDGGPFILKVRRVFDDPSSEETVVLHKGEIFVTPRGVQHLPCPEEEVSLRFAESKEEETAGDVKDS